MTGLPIVCYAPPVPPQKRLPDRTAPLAPLALSAALLAGCSSAAPPRATVTDARLRDRGPEAAVVEFVIGTENPNDIELPLRDITYTLSLDGQQVFSGRREAMATIPRHGSQSVVIPAVIPMGEEGVAPEMHEYTLSARVRYSLPSQLADLLFDTNVSRPSVSLTDRGQIDLR